MRAHPHGPINRIDGVVRDEAMFAIHRIDLGPKQTVIDPPPKTPAFTAAFTLGRERDQFPPHAVPRKDQQITLPRRAFSKGGQGRALGAHLGPERPHLGADGLCLGTGGGDLGLGRLRAIAQIGGQGAALLGIGDLGVGAHGRHLSVALNTQCGGGVAGAGLWRGRVCW